MVFDPDSILVPTPLANRPNSLANEVAHCFAVGPLLRSLYSKEAPVVGSMTELMPYACFCSIIVMTSVAIEYRDDTVGLPVERATRLHASCCCMLALVG